VPVTLDLGEFATLPAGEFTYDNDQQSAEPDDQTQDEQTQPATATASVGSGP